VQPTAYQAAVTSVQGQANAGGAGSSTQVLYTNPWQAPGGSAWQAPAGVRSFGDRGGDADARRQRRLWLGGLAVGTAAAISVIGVIVANMGGSPSSATAADTKPAVAATTPSATTPASPTGSPSPSVSPGGAVLADGQSGLAYTQLPAPWQGTSCPAALSNDAFTWTAGEAAVAGPVNGGQSTWYGEACSGPLPQRYGYNGVASLPATAAQLANTFENAYYNDLPHAPAVQEVSQPVHVSGHTGWEVTYQITYTNAAAQGATWTDEQAAVVVVDTGSGNTPAVFFTSIPGSLNESNVTSLVSSLQLPAVPASSVSAPPSASAPPDHGHGGGDGNNP
jgi:hypothetical protein